MNRFFAAHVSNNSLANHLEILSQILPESRTFLISTITGYKILQPAKIGFLEYLKEKKHWYAHSDKKTFNELKRGTTAEMILSYHPSFIQINQQQIVNFDYLFKIDDKKCVLTPPFSDQANLSISRDYFKAFRDRFDMI
jgi:two-component system, LytTR family, response regulator